MSKQYEIDKAGHILNSDNKFEISYDNGMDCAGVEMDGLSISTAAGVCWLHLEALDATDTHQDFALNVAGQQVNIRVMADGTARLNEPLGVTV